MTSHSIHYDHHDDCGHLSERLNKIISAQQEQIKILNDSLNKIANNPSVTPLEHSDFAKQILELIRKLKQ